MKQIFFKTVKSDGRSVYARGRLARIYKVGERYRFSKQLPAHVFKADRHNTNDDTTIESDVIYHNRAEGAAGNRVLICYGNLKREEVPVFSIDVPTWDLNKIKTGDWVNKEYRWTSTDFVVIGEIALPKCFDGKRPHEYSVSEYDGKLIDFNSLKNLKGHVAHMVNTTHPLSA